MMKQLILFTGLASLFTACRTSEFAKGTPDCVKSKIQSFSPQACEKGANVKSYYFQNKTVYVFDRGRCGADFTSEVIDSTCKQLGHLGGFVGNMEINGENFSNAKFKEIVWEKPEGAPSPAPPKQVPRTSSGAADK